MGLISKIFGRADSECPPNHVWRSVALDKSRLARVMALSAKTGVKPGTLINAGIEMMIYAYDRDEIDLETQNGDDVKVILKVVR